MVDAMKNANKELKTQMKSIDIDDIEDLHDDMSEMLEMTDEIQEVMGRSYDVNQNVDESELLDELNSLEDQIDTEVEAGVESEAVADGEAVADSTPSYLVSAASAANKVTATAAPAGMSQPNTISYRHHIYITCLLHRLMY